jgi:hypothetical protein
MGWVIGMLASAAFAAMRDRTAKSSERRDLEPLDACAMSIVLVGVDGSRVSRAVDDATGGLGWSHVLFDPCRREGERSMVVDYTVRGGVHWSTLEPYARRRLEYIALDPVAAGETWGCIRSKLGRPFRPLDLVAGHSEAGSCVGLIVSCLPWSMQEAMRPLIVGPCISPNTIAAYFGVTS